MRSSPHERGFTLLVCERVQEGEDLAVSSSSSSFSSSRNACVLATNSAFAFSFSCRFFFTSFSQCGGSPSNRWVGGWRGGGGRGEGRRGELRGGGWREREERRGEGDVSARSACSTCCQLSPHQVRGMQLEWASSQGSSTVRFNRTDAAIPHRPLVKREERHSSMLRRRTSGQGCV